MSVPACMYVLLAGIPSSKSDFEFITQQAFRGHRLPLFLNKVNVWME